MRNRFSKILIVALMGLLLTSFAYAQETEAVTQETATEETTTQETATAVQESSGLKGVAEFLFGRAFVQLFINGGWVMWPLLAVAIYGLAYIIWKFISLMYAKVNLNDYLNQILPLIKDKKIKEATELSQKTRGPVAAVVYAGLLKADKGVDAVEKNMENAAMIEMSYLEKGFVEMSTAITLAPMLGFFGTVTGMIVAFDSISKARSVDATIVADGIKIALITTQAGLAIGIVVQFFYNIFTTMVDGMVIDMQRASEKVTEALIES